MAKLVDPETRTARVLAVIGAQWMTQGDLYKASKMSYDGFVEAVEALVKRGCVSRAKGYRQVGSGRSAILYRRRQGQETV